MADDPRLIDKRVAQRYLRKGLLDEKEYRRYLDSLPDLAEQVDEIESRFEPGATPRPSVSPTAPGAAGPSDGAEE